MNPSELGWQEVLVRLGLLVFAVAFTAVAAAAAVRVALHAIDGLKWLIRKGRKR